MRKVKSDLPEAIVEIADRLVDVSQRNLERSKKLKLDVDTVGIKQYEYPQNVEEWTNKHFLHWFVDQCKNRLNIPYVVHYARDYASISSIRGKLEETGYVGEAELKDFLQWAVNTSDHIKNVEGYFTLNTIKNFINEYLQSRIDERTKVSLAESENGIQLVDEMKALHSEKGAFCVLHTYGIPLSAAYFLMRRDLATVRQGINQAISEAVQKQKFAELEDIIKNSIYRSPYPPGFDFTSWREDFREFWEAVKAPEQSWWRGTDFGGDFNPAYQIFNEDSVSEKREPK